jgi:alkanesulfonate monooxygenase SsuD/methylene tetrahydromethanopterin reductase-like flavin-dependent oxidoreductase (luciferase family)
MRFGIHVPNFGDFYDLPALASLAREAEDNGWDGFFLWDHMQYGRSRRAMLQFDVGSRG